MSATESILLALGPAPEAGETPPPPSRRGWRPLKRLRELREKPAARFAATIPLTAAALGLTLLVRELFPGITLQVPFFLLAIVAAGWFGGFLPGMLSCVLSVVCMMVFLPVPGRDPLSAGELFRLSVHFTAGAGVSWLGGLQLRRETALLRANESLEETVRGRTAVLRGTLDAATDAIFAEDENGSLLSCNRRFLEMWDIPVSGEESPNTRDLRGVVAPKLKNPSLFLLRAAEIDASGEDSFDLLELEDGRYLERYSRPLLVNGRPSGRVWSFRDVTERFRAERNARRLAAIVDNSNDAIISKDLKGIITSWNPAAERIFGYRADEVVGGTLSGLIPPERRGEEEEILGTLKSGGRVDHFETVRIHKNGSLVHVSLTVSPVRDGHGVMTGVSKISRDITGQRILEEEARRQRDRLKEAEEVLKRKEAELARVARATVMGELTASISHEINQPLAAAAAGAGACRRWLSARPPNVEEALASVQNVGRDVKRAAEIIRRIRGLFVKGDSGEEGERPPADLSETAGEVAAMLRGEAVRRGAALECSLAAGLPPARMDPVQIQQILLNLVLNALDAMEGAGAGAGARAVRLRTGSSMSGREVFAEVEDTGPGLSPEVRERLFEAFFTTKAQGLGMGLSISRSIAQAHGGRLEAEAAPAGTGALFRLILPAAGTDGTDGNGEGGETVSGNGADQP